MAFTIKPTKRPTTDVKYSVDWQGRKQDDFGSRVIVSLEKARAFCKDKQSSGSGYRVTVQKLTTTSHVEELDVKELLIG
jgi:hypothetical protein